MGIILASISEIIPIITWRTLPFKRQNMISFITISSSVNLCPSVSSPFELFHFYPVLLCSFTYKHLSDFSWNDLEGDRVNWQPPTVKEKTRKTTTVQMICLKVKKKEREEILKLWEYFKDRRSLNGRDESLQTRMKRT